MHVYLRYCDGRSSAFGSIAWLMARTRQALLSSGDAVMANHLTRTLALAIVPFAMRLRHARARPPPKMGVRELRALCTSSCHHPFLVKPSERLRVTIPTMAIGHGCIMRWPPKRCPPARRPLPDQYGCVRESCRFLVTREENTSAEPGQMHYNSPRN